MGSVVKVKIKNSFVKAPIPDSFQVVNNISLGGRVTDTELWMPSNGFQFAPAYQGTNNVVWQS